MAKLEEYRKKRKFDRTPEPFGEPERPDQPPEPEAEGRRKRLPNPKLSLLEIPAEARYGDTFVVQKHRATRLHYDFRLAINGALVSWAVPKGPSLNSADKRLAVQTEDHPLEYGGFEGKIPEGSYGAGTVMGWDRGTFAVKNPPGRNLDAAQQIQKGEIKFSLNGEKLRGSFVLVKLKKSDKGNEWLMIKHKDAAEDAKWNIDEHDGSVLTGRTIEEIKEESPPKRSPSPLRPEELQDAHRAPMPSRLEPMLATIGDKPFSNPNWLFEIKWDGVRALAWIDNGKLTIRARSGAEITARYPELASLPTVVAAREAILDGEIAAMDAHGRSDFGLLQERMHVRAPAENLIARVPVVFFAFDLVYCDGYDLRRSPLIERKQFLQLLLHTTEKIRFSDHQLERGKEIFELAKANGLEGIVAKRIDSTYVSERSLSWLKLKLTKTVDAVIGGWSEARTASIPLGSLLLGLYEGKRLRFIGHVGTGFDGKKLEELSGRLKKLETSSCPFDAVPETNEKAHWVSPTLVARVKFGEWTQEKALRHPVFIALREDVRPEDSKWQDEVAAAESAPRAANPAVVHAPAVVGKVISKKAQIEEELFAGRAETITIELDGKRLRLTNLNKIYF